MESCMEPNTEKRCIIFTAYLHGDAAKVYTPREGDIVLCADGGYAVAKAIGVTPHKILGDCDSITTPNPPVDLLIRLPKEKDDTDTMLCMRYALELGCTQCLIIGGIGGRLDHTIANIQTLAFAHANRLRAEMEDEYERVFLLENSARDLPQEQNALISLFAYTPSCAGVSICGVKYPLQDATLTHAFPLGVSNVFIEPVVRVSVREGILLVILTKRSHTAL